MEVLIIEDEKLASDRLINMIRDIEPSTHILNTVESVRSAVLWLKNHPEPDLIFMDIHLADGISFQIFEKTEVHAPVIFTTAYNEYALRAFKVNSIDYLLKPIDKQELRAAFLKFMRVRNVPLSPIPDHVQKTQVVLNYAQVMKEMMEMMTDRFKSRFIIRIGEHLKTIFVEDVVFFYSNEKSSYIRTENGRDFAMDCSLDQIENEVNPKLFFRVSRKHLISLKPIRDIIAYSGSRLKLILAGNATTEILVSREKVADFKKWLEG